MSQRLAATFTSQLKGRWDPRRKLTFFYPEESVLVAAPLGNRKLLTENFVICEQAYGSKAFCLRRQLQSKGNSEPEDSV